MMWRLWGRLGCKKISTCDYIVEKDDTNWDQERNISVFLVVDLDCWQTVHCCKGGTQNYKSEQESDTFSSK